MLKVSNDGPQAFAARNHVWQVLDGSQFRQRLLIEGNARPVPVDIGSEILRHRAHNPKNHPCSFWPVPRGFAPRLIVATPAVSTANACNRFPDPAFNANDVVVCPVIQPFADPRSRSHVQPMSSPEDIMLTLATGVVVGMLVLLGGAYSRSKIPFRIRLATVLLAASGVAWVVMESPVRAALSASANVDERSWPTCTNAKRR